MSLNSVIRYLHAAYFLFSATAHYLQKQISDSILPGLLYVTSTVLQHPSSLCCCLPGDPAQMPRSGQARSLLLFASAMLLIFPFLTQYVILSTLPHRKLMIITYFSNNHSSFFSRFLGSLLIPSGFTLDFLNL